MIRKHLLLGAAGLAILVGWQHWPAPPVDPVIAAKLAHLEAMEPVASEVWGICEKQVLVDDYLDKPTQAYMDALKVCVEKEAAKRGVTVEDVNFGSPWSDDEDEVDTSEPDKPEQNYRR